MKVTDSSSVNYNDLILNEEDNLSKKKSFKNIPRV